MENKLAELKYLGSQTGPSLDISSMNLSENCDSSNKSNMNLILNNSQTNLEEINKLLKRTGYPLCQENGQRKFGPPSDWGNKTIPDRGCEAFIGKIPRDCFEDELIPILERIGPIYEFRLMMEYSGFNRGFGFVMYTSREHAKKCVNELNNYEIRKGRMIGVCRSVDNCRLFVGGIPKNKKRDEILEEMKKVTEDVVNVIVYPCAHDKTKNRGFAFVQYSSHRAAAIARRKLIPNRIQIFGQPIAVDWAEPEAEVDEDIMATVKIVYVRNLMLTTSEETIKIEFEKAIGQGSIERVKKMKDFAFVHFKEREDAISCINKLNGTSIEGSIIELSLSKPADKASLQKLLRTSPNALELNVLLNQNILPNTPILTFPLINDPQFPLLNNDFIFPDNQSVSIPIKSETILNYPPVSYISNNINVASNLNNNNSNNSNNGKVKYSSKGAAYNRYSNPGKSNHVLGTVKKQPPNQDVPYEFLPNYNQIPVLPYPNLPQYLNKTSVQLLEEICIKEGLNSPIYTLHTTPGTDQDGREIGLFMYKISISNFLNGSPICSNRLMRTIEDAKHDAAEYVISQIFPNQNYADLNGVIMPGTMIPTAPYILSNGEGLSNNANSFNVTTTSYLTDQLPSVDSSLNSSTNSQYLMSSQQPQYILDSSGQYFMYQTQPFY
ncbi:unnamed protein product [Brachionus calyciflorus]|uniref:RRM domain-containing protein n=1 Tax=Brachionus calyciflorus TaxID=104777 RepID=A0A813ZWW2_9BILA|nr:unnamed protein product [Brachionus calyciflorus]